jgi:hypothetical protein
VICPIRAACLTKRQAPHGLAEWFAVELKRKFPDKLDDIIIAVKAKFDRDVSSRHCAWLKPETAAKIEQLATQAAKAIQSVEGSATIPSWSTRCSCGTGARDARRRAGDVLTQKAKELALIRLEVSGGMLFGLAHEFQEAPASAQVRHGESRLGSRSQRPARSDRAQKLLERCRTRTARTR